MRQTGSITSQGRPGTMMTSRIICPTNYSFISFRKPWKLVRSGVDSDLDISPEFPSSSAEIVQQCYKAIKSAYSDGVTRQRVEIILPLIGATDIDDWPGGIRQQFKAAQPMVEDILVQLKNLPGLEGPLSAKIIDDADAVGAWSGENVSLVLFPTAETIGDLRRITEATKKLQVIVNPQWNTEGNVINDFGVLPWVRQPALELVKSFKDTYIVKQLRINGDNTRWIYFHGYGWKVSVVRGPKEMTTVLTSQVKPTYKEVEDELRKLPWTMSSKGLFDRIQAEAEFNRKSLESLPPSNE